MDAIKKYGVIESLFIGFWTGRRKFFSFLACLVYNIRGYDIAYSTLFCGHTWMRRSVSGSIKIGKNCMFGEQVRLMCGLEGRIEIGDNVTIGDYTIISACDSIKIGDNSMVSQFCYIVDTSHNFENKKIPMIQQGVTAKPVKIGENVWVGVNVKVLQGVTIGRDSIVGAGAVVTKNVAPESIVAGVPAKLLHTR